MLLEEAFRAGWLRNKKETIDLALRAVVNRRKQLEIVESFGDDGPGSGL
jgi:Arc/MetJ family transcription regulator